MFVCFQCRINYMTNTVLYLKLSYWLLFWCVMSIKTSSWKSSSSRLRLGNGLVGVTWEPSAGTGSGYVSVGPLPPTKCWKKSFYAYTKCNYVAQMINIIIQGTLILWKFKRCHKTKRINHRIYILYPVYMYQKGNVQKEFTKTPLNIII